MHQILVLGVVILAAFASAKPARTPFCKHIGRKGCSTELKNTGKVCGTDGKTYWNRCLLEKKSCKVPSANLEIKYFAPCQQTEPQQQAAGGTGGEETVIGVGPGNQPGDTPDDEDTPDDPDGTDSPDGTDAPDVTDAPDNQDPGAQNRPGSPDAQDPGAGNQNIPDATQAPTAPPAGGGGDSGSSSGSSSEEAGGGGGGGAGAGGPAAPATTMPPLTTQPPLLSPEPKTCPENCPPAQQRDQVCGSDGNTYESLCILQQYKCDTNDTVTPVHLGSCNNTCGPECPMVYEPVCGTDGLTYMSRCDLLRTACLTVDQKLEVRNKSECAEIASLKNCVECEPIPDEVCSTNNMTFRSQCEFDRFVCLFDVRGINISHNGSCPNAPLVCPNYCQDVKDPLCASDGRVYPNLCELGVAGCHAEDQGLPEITFVEYGEECASGTPNPCSPDAPECDLMEQPVCAQKGKEQVTYYNRCFFEKERCFDPSVKFASEGKCPKKP